MSVASAPGTGSFALNGATSAFQTWAAAGAADGGTYTYLAEEGTAWEVGVGTYSASTAALARTLVQYSSNGNAAVNFGPNAIVSQVFMLRDVADSLPGVGDLVWTLGGVAPAGTLKLNGPLLSRFGAYAPLWAWVQAQPASLLIPDSTWQGGQTGCFSTGDGSSNFRIPDYRGEGIRAFDDSRGLDAGRVIGSLQFQNLPNHQHQMPFGFDNGYGYGWLGSDSAPTFGSELVANSNRVQFTATAAGGPTTIRIAWTNSAIVSTAGELRTRNVAPLACIRYK
jgi:microcystin-dependent protein